MLSTWSHGGWTGQEEALCALGNVRENPFQAGPGLPWEEERKREWEKGREREKRKEGRKERRRDREKEIKEKIGRAHV